MDNFYPDPVKVAMEGHPSVETVQNELTAIQQEMELAEYYAHLAAIAQIRHQWIRDNSPTITSRRAMQEFTKKQMKLGEQILARLRSNSTIGNT